MKLLKEDVIGFEEGDVTYTEVHLRKLIKSISDRIDDEYYDYGYHLTENQVRAIFDLVIKDLSKRGNNSDGGLFDDNGEIETTVINKALNNLNR